MANGDDSPDRRRPGAASSGRSAFSGRRVRRRRPRGVPPSADGGAPAVRPPLPRRTRRDIWVLGAAIGVFGVSFGVLSTTAGLSLAQTCVMSLLALVVVNTLAGDRRLELDARAVGLAVAVVATWRRAPFAVVVVCAAASTALVRALAP